MNAIIARKHRIALAAIALVGLYGSAAGAATVHGGNTDAMDHWYGRAGGLAGSDVVSEPQAWQQGGQPVQVTYSEAVAQWTNMPRDQAHEGPVTTGMSGPSQTVPSADNSSAGATGAVANHPASAPSSMTLQPTPASQAVTPGGEDVQRPEQYGRAGDDALLEQMQATVHPVPALPGEGQGIAANTTGPESYGRAGDATLMEHMQAVPHNLSSIN